MFRRSVDKDKPARGFQPLDDQSSRLLARKPSRDELVNTDSGYILYLEDITVSFDGFKALNELTLYIQTG